MIKTRLPKAFLGLLVGIFILYPLPIVRADEEIWHRVDYNNTVYDIIVDTTVPLGEDPLFKSDYEDGSLAKIRIAPQLSQLSEVRNLIFAAQTIRLLKYDGFSYYIAIAPFHRQEFPTTRTDNQGNNYDLYGFPGFGDYPPLVGGWLGPIYFDGLDNFEKRKHYYLSYLTQSILQPDRYQDLVSKGKAVEILKGFCKSVPPAAKGAEEIIEIITGSSYEHIRGRTISVETLRGPEGEEFFNYWNSPPSDSARIQSLLQKTQTAFQGATVVSSVGLNVLQNIMLDTLVFKPESYERIEAFQKFIDTTPNLDPALLQAFDEFKVDFEKILDNHGTAIEETLLKSFLTPEVLLNTAQFANSLYLSYNTIGVNAQIAKTAGFALMIGSWILDLWADLDTVNSAIIAGSVHWEIAKYLESIYQSLDFSQSLDFNQAKEIASLYSISSYSGYLFYNNLEKFCSISILNPYSWIKYVGFVLSSFSLSYQAESVEYFHEYAEFAIYWRDTEQISNQYISGYSYWYEWLPSLAYLPDFKINCLDVSLSPTELSSPGAPINIEVNVHNDGISEGDAEIRVTFGALHASFASVQSSSIQTVPNEGSSQFNFSMDTTNFLPDNYYVTVQVVNRSDKPELDEKNNVVSFGYTVGGTEPAFIKAFPLIEVEQSIPGGEHYYLLDLSKYFYDDNPQEITIEAKGYSKLVVNVDENNVAHIRGDYGWVGTEQVTFIIKDQNGGEKSQVAYITVTASENKITLTGGDITPYSGTSGTVFEYKVKYKDLEGRFPQSRSAYINGIPYTMKWSGTPIIEGSEFTLNKLGKDIVTDGNCFYYFVFGYSGQQVRYPVHGVLEGPDISITHDVRTMGLRINPDEPRQGQPCDISFKVENIGSVIEFDLVARLFIDGNEVNSISVGNLGVADSSKVITFTWMPTIQDETHQYDLTVEVDPVSGEANLVDNSSSIQRTVKPERGQITGWVFDQFNNPIEGAFVKVITSSAEEYGSTKTDYDGWYILDGLMPGTYGLKSYKEGEGSAIKYNVDVHSLEETENQIFNLYPQGMTLITSGQYLEDAHWSPSGDKLVFTYSIRLSPTDTRTILTRINEDGSGAIDLTGPGKTVDEEAELPKWSPSGNYIMFHGKKTTSGSRGIYRISATGNGNDAVRIVDGSVQGITWSPDSQYIAYTPGGNEIWRVTYVGANPVQLSNTGREHRELAWSPDGTKIAFNDNFGKLWVFDVNDYTEHMIRDSGYYPSWLPDSSGILYYDGKGGSCNIWLYYLEADADVQVTFDPEYEMYPTIPKDDLSKIAFISDKGFPEIGDFGLFKMPFSPPSLYFTEISAQPDPFTPNGDGEDDYLNISYSINKSAYVTLKIHDSQGNYVKTLVDNELQDANAYNISWDGKNQYGLSQNAEVYFYRLDMHDINEVAIPAHGRIGMLKDIHDLESGGAEHPRWSHLGDKIVYLKLEYDPNVGGSVYHIYICDANDLTNKQIVPTPFNVGERPAWSRNDDQIVFPSYSGDPDKRPQIAKVNIDGTGYTDLTVETLGSLLCGTYPCWSSVEDVIVFNGLWNEPYEGNFYYITKINSDGNGMQKIEDYCEREQPVSPVWSPDGSKIAWATDMSGNYDIWIVNADDPNIKEQLTFNPYKDISPEFTSDGKRLLFSSNRHVGRGSIPELWTKPLDDSDGPRCLCKKSYGVASPDGNNILGPGCIIDLFVSLTKGTIEGEVLDSEDLNPIEGAFVSLWQDSNNSIQTVTNEEGGYQFSNVDPCGYLVEVNAPGYITETIAAEAFPWCFTRGVDFVLTTLPVVQITSLDVNDVIQGTIQIFGEGTSSNTSQIVYQYALVDTYDEMLAMQPQSTQSYNWVTIGTSDPYHPVQWDVSNMSSGEYLIRAVAYDEFGNADDLPQIISVTVDGIAPTANFSNIDNNDVVTGIIELKAISDDDDLSCVRFEYKLHDDIIWSTIGFSSSSPYNIFWDTSNLLHHETYDLKAVANDIYGNEDDSPDIISVTVIEPIRPEECDFNNDNIVDLIDFAHLAENWLRADCSEDNDWCEQCDFDKMGSVNFSDLWIFTENWLWRRINGDIDSNGKVNFIDFAFLANQWNTVPGVPSADIAPTPDGDNFVDFLDLAWLAEHWLAGIK